MPGTVHCGWTRSRSLQGVARCVTGRRSPHWRQRSRETSSTASHRNCERSAMVSFGVWRKSSFSGTNPENRCVELAALDGKISLRESDDPAEVVTITPASLGVFIRTAKRGGLDHLTPTR
ncbi:DUF397 domain-containing protein [Streptomyces sp. NPDC007983]|uniref:DUF397 domain-containing protein n=1 Tax=Streptomyces sp. NPDC007983 TaxID=3364800 RepID=UPI0036E622C4